METALRTLLIGNGTIAGLVGTRIVWNHLPQSTADPAVVLYKITGAEGHTFQGRDGMQESIVQVDVRALTVASMWQVRDAIIARLDGYRDADFAGIFLRSERQSAEKPGAVLYHRSSLDFDVFHRTAV
jgi:hypothetical protein